MTCTQVDCPAAAVVSYEWAGKVCYACSLHMRVVMNVADAIGLPLIFRDLEGKPVARFEPS